jgi:hypothetical protein
MAPNPTRLAAPGQWTIVAVKAEFSEMSHRLWAIDGILSLESQDNIGKQPHRHLL